MGENSHISWTDHTHNEWIGCTKVSAGCDNCYAEREQDLRYGRARWGKGNARYRTSEANRRKPFSWDRKAAAEGRRYKIFTASLSDVFDEEVPDDWRDSLFSTIRATPHLDWLVLTKRVSKMLRYTRQHLLDMPSNVWWGCSIEDQDTAARRIPELLKLRALAWPKQPILWLSIEPLVGPIDASSYLVSRSIDWVIVGGESGSRARQMQNEWALALRDQCSLFGVPFHFKQWGEHDSAGVRVGKKTAGRILDGREWNDAPVLA
jgi:protein gp37